MTIAPIAAEDAFSVTQGLTSTTVTGNLGADNGAGLDYDPDGTVLGWVAGIGFTPIGDGDRYLGAFFSNGTLAFLHIMGTVSYPFPVIVTSTGTATAEGGMVWLDTSGNFSYQSALGFSGVDSFTYTLVDSEFNVTTTTVTITVDGVEGANDRPIAADDAFAVNEDTVLSGNLLADNGNGVDSDPDGDVLHVNNHTIYTQAGGLVHIYADGSFTYTAKAGYSGADGFDYTLLDPTGAKDIGHVSLTVLAVNDSPLAVDDHFEVIHDRTLSGSVLTGNGNGADTDQDGDTLTVIAAVLTTAAGGQVSILADGSFSYQPAAGYLGEDSFDYTVTDPNGASDLGHVTLNVVNHAPVVALDRFDLAYRGSVSGNLMVNNGDGADSDPDGDAISVVAGQFVTARGSVLTVSADGHFHFAASDLSYGLELVSYQLFDSMGATSTGTVQFWVAGHGGHQGSYLDENWTGVAGADIAMMAGGDDTVDGLGGNDVIGGGANDDTIYGGLGNDRLYGEADKDELYGGGGADRLDGGAGRDQLKGGAGADKFVISTGPAYDSDRIVDFASIDRLVFDASELGLSGGPLADASWLVAKGAADGDHGRFVYDARTRSLSWDDDGAAATAGLLLVTFDTKVALTIDSFLLI